MELFMYQVGVAAQGFMDGREGTGHVYETIEDRLIYREGRLDGIDDAASVFGSATMAPEDRRIYHEPTQGPSW